VAGVPTVAPGGQGGMLDVALAPDFAKSRIIYLSYSEPRPNGRSLALARATLKDGAAPSLQGLEVIFRAGSDGTGEQFGGNIAFSPDHKLLYLSTGERQRFTPSQDPDQAIGKILRLTLDGKPAPGNPNYAAGGARAETWSIGHRNPYGLSFDKDGRLWEIEMGPKGGDEVNLIQPGKNYGWPKASNGSNYDDTPIPDHAPGDGFEPPKVWWNPSISPGGLMIYSGAMFPTWQGSAFIAALSGQALIRVSLDGDKAAKADQWNMGMRIRDVAQAPDGAIWLLQDGRGNAGHLMRLTPR
jgi:glucose/arabinose dehydrogenase